MIKVITKAYGEGEYISHDPRFPGYISAKFNIKGKEIVINNLRKRDIEFIIERHEAEVLKEDKVEEVNVYFQTIGTVYNRKGTKVNIEHQIKPKKDFEAWIVEFSDKVDPEIGVFTYIYYDAPEDKYNLNEFLNIKDFKY